MIRLTATTSGLVLEQGARCALAPLTFSLDALFTAEDPVAFARAALASGTPHPSAPGQPVLRAPIQSQEVWAAGVTYLRSKNARMAESKDAGGGTFYDKVGSSGKFRHGPQRSQT